MFKFLNLSFSIILGISTSNILLMGNSRYENYQEDSISVSTYQEFYQAVIDENVKEINFNNDIILENTVPINLSKRDVVINGNNFTLIEGNSLNSRIQTQNAMQLTINNLKIQGRNKYGTFSPVVGVEKVALEIIFNNVEYSGPQLIYNPYGKVIFQGNNNITLKQQDIIFNISHDVEEVGEVNILIFDVGSVIDVKTEGETLTNKSVFWFKGETKELVIKKNVKLNVEYEEAFSLFYQYDDRRLVLEENAQLLIKTQNILYGSFAFSNIVLEKGAYFEFKSTSNYGSLHSLNDIVLKENAHLIISVGGEENPILLKNDGKMVIYSQAKLLLTRESGQGVFLDDLNSYNIEIKDNVSIKSKQDNFLLQWDKVDGEVKVDKKNTSVFTNNPTINGLLDLSKSSYFEINIANDNQQERLFLTYEKGISKSEEQFYQDLHLLSDDNIQYHSGYEKNWTQKVDTYNTLIRMDNLVEKTSTFFVVELQVIDTTPPIIQVYTDVEQHGIHYFEAQNKNEHAFLTDIGARTDDGSPITIINFESIDFAKMGIYEVTLNAIDEYGNVALPKNIFIIIEKVPDNKKYVIQADDFSLYVADLLQVETEEELNQLLLLLSNANVIETNSNNIIYEGMFTEVEGDFIHENISYKMIENNEIYHKGYNTINNEKKYGNLSPTDKNILIQNNKNNNSFSYGRQFMIYSGIITTLVTFVVGIYIFLQIKIKKKV